MAKKKMVLTTIILCIITITVTVAIAAVNLLINDSVAASVTIKGNIEFYGGHDLGENVVYVNPQDARPVASDRSGIQASSVNWWISEPGIDEPLYSGFENDLETTLTSMCKNGKNGMYVLQFCVETESGDAYRMGRNFYIIADEPG